MPNFDKESLIRWDDIAPSLQEKFTTMANDIDKNMNSFDNLIQNSRLTISTDPPMHPETNRDVWWDDNYDVVRSYMAQYNDKGQLGASSWQYTRGAWYGGSHDDIKQEVIPAPTVKWTKVKSLVWISNVATNNSYTTTDESPRTSYYTIMKDGYYRIVDNCNLFQYNAQSRYTHDGGALTVVVYKQSGSTNTEIYRKAYDSRSTYTSNNGGTRPQVTQQFTKGQRISVDYVTGRNPQSTDSVEIYQIGSIAIYRLNYGDPNTD